MRAITLVLFLTALGCHGPSRATGPDALTPEWPELQEPTPVEIDAPRWVETALDAPQPESLIETESAIFLSTYQHTLSRVDGPTCRFRPTCSAFAHRAVSHYGLVGLILSFGRLQRAHKHDRARYGADGRLVVDEVDDHTFWFAPAGDPRWFWHEQVESSP